MRYLILFNILGIVMVAADCSGTEDAFAISQRGYQNSEGNRSTPNVIKGNAEQGVTGGATNRQKLFLEGKKLIEDNCSDCYGATAGNIKRGIEKLEAALNAGYEPKIEVLKQLREGYSILAFGPFNKSYDKKMISIVDQITQEMLKLDPNNLEWQLAVAENKEIAKNKIDAIKQIVSQNDGYAPAHFALGSCLWELGQKAEAIKEYERAYRLASGLVAVSYGQQLVLILKQNGEFNRAKNVEDELRKKY
jgi:tetratricopeptide (TPR) repeat protein